MNPIRFTLFLAAIFVAVTTTYPADAARVCNRLFPVTVGSDTLYQRYCANHDLTINNGSIRELHIFVHGVSRTAPSFTALLIPDINGGVTRRMNTIAIVAPQYIRASTSDPSDNDNGNTIVNEYDVSTGTTLDLGGVHKDNLYYGAGWWRGDLSFSGTSEGWINAARPFRISAHEVMDRILARAVQSWPNLRRILIYGHSGGGRMMGLYIMSANIPSGFPEENVFFGIANPTSSAYFDRGRPTAPLAVPPVFVTPTSALCDGLVAQGGSTDPGNFGGYDDFTAAIIDDSPADGVCDDCNSHFAQYSPAELKARFLRRNYIRQIGLNDNDATDSSMGADCANHLQGDHRLARAEAYSEHVINYFGWEKWVKSYEMLYVPGVAHSGTGLWRSTCGRYATLGLNANSAAPNGGTCASPYVFYDSFDNGMGLWTLSGSGTVATSTQRRVKTAYAARFLGAQSRTITSPLIEQAGSYTISWAWRIGSRLKAGDTIVAQRSINGGTWTEMARLTGDSDKENVWHFNGRTLAASTSIRIRFIVTVSAGADRDVWLDEVRIVRRLGIPQ